MLMLLPSGLVRHGLVLVMAYQTPSKQSSSAPCASLSYEVAALIAGELASNLAGDFLATAFHLHHLFSRLRRAVWGKPAHDAAGDDSPTDTSPFTPFSPFSNSPGPQWDQLGTPTSTLRYDSAVWVRESPQNSAATRKL